MPRPRRLNPGHSEGAREELRRIGGHPALDFANTVDQDRKVPETLTSYERLLSWCEGGEILTRSDAAYLRALARKDPKSAHHWLREAIVTRTTAATLFTARAGGRRAPDAAIKAFNRKLRLYAPPTQLTSDGLTYRRGLQSDELDLNEPVRRIVDLVASFLGSRDFAHVRLCEGTNCGWFFIDRSPTRRRRWCSMAGCGNRAKANRHYRQAKAAKRINVGTRRRR